MEAGGNMEGKKMMNSSEGKMSYSQRVLLFSFELLKLKHLSSLPKIKIYFLKKSKNTYNIYLLKKTHNMYNFKHNLDGTEFKF